MTRRWVYTFEEGRAGMRELLGGKGASLAEMTALGLPVPPGFTVTAEACREFQARGGFPDGLEAEVLGAMVGLETHTGKRFGDPDAPLLVSVRSGAAVSMPGMMDTILNLGLNDETTAGLARATGDERFAWDCYRRFIQMFGDVVLKVPHSRFAAALERAKDRCGVQLDMELDAGALRELVGTYGEIIRDTCGHPFPADPREQLVMAVRAVFDSWKNERAIVYRRFHGIPDDLGTAVNVQAMVFGNMGVDSGTGVVFTRDPSTGEPSLYGEFLANAQGEDVVAGIRTPSPIAELARTMPAVHEELVRVARVLERHFRDVQDIEFTVERGRLYMLQCRNAKRTAAAAVRVAHDMQVEGLIAKEEAFLRVDPEDLERMLHRTIDPSSTGARWAEGLPASPGAASGAIVLDADEAERKGLAGEPVILVRMETNPDDIHGIVQAQGVLTSRGGMTCHAAVVARGMGKPCVVGCESLRIDVARGVVEANGVVLREGDAITIDGATGAVYVGSVRLVEPELVPEFRAFLGWADEFRRLEVRANADTPEDARRARDFGATGIGLCRTEHMFMAVDRLPVVQAMILAEDEAERRDALDRLLPMQQGDFEAILAAMEGYPVTIRLLDPPLHEFLPDKEELVAEAARLRATGSDPGRLQEVTERLHKVEALAEANPMLGHRGCRLGITSPDVYAMQARAICRAAVNLRRRGVVARPEIMIPLVGHVRELAELRRLVEEVRRDVEREAGMELDIPVGTMIEVPRAALTADEIAGEADFFSFGTNDLTQMTFGFSRDDAEAKFLHVYLERGILEDNPFSVLDRKGVGKLVQMGVQLGRAARPGLKVGICGEHGGNPASIAFCHEVGLDYVSCSPFRVPIARVAAAQAALRAKGEPAA